MRSFPGGRCGGDSCRYEINSPHQRLSPGRRAAPPAVHTGEVTARGTGVIPGSRKEQVGKWAPETRKTPAQWGSASGGASGALCPVSPHPDLVAGRQGLRIGGETYPQRRRRVRPHVRSGSRTFSHSKYLVQILSPGTWWGRGGGDLCGPPFYPCLLGHGTRCHLCKSSITCLSITCHLSSIYESMHLSIICD